MELFKVRDFLQSELTEASNLNLFYKDVEDILGLEFIHSLVWSSLSGSSPVHPASSCPFI